MFCGLDVLWFWLYRMAPCIWLIVLRWFVYLRALSQDYYFFKICQRKIYPTFKIDLVRILHGIVVITSACHAGNLGSIPSGGVKSSFLLYVEIFNWINIFIIIIYIVIFWICLIIIFERYLLHVCIIVYMVSSYPVLTIKKKRNT